MSGVKSTIFDKLDNSTVHIGSLYPIAVFKNIKRWRKYFLILSLVSLLLWGILGFDSTMEQVTPFTENILELLTGKVSLDSLFAQSRALYGIGNHWSAPVIYGFAFIFLSLHLESVGIVKSYNFVATTILSLANIGVFETFWNRTFAYFQNQPWTISFAWKQGSNTIQFFGWIVLGILTLLYLISDGYRLTISRKFIILLTLSIMICTFWIYYPYPTQQLSVQTTTGTWTSTPYFPQTMYTIDIDPTDNIAVGVPHFVENNLVHFTNTLAKVLVSGTILSICMVKRRIP